MTGEKSRYVLEEDEAGMVSPHKVEEGVGEAGSGSGSHASSLPGDGEVLAWKTAGPEASIGKPSGSTITVGSAKSPTNRTSEVRDVTEVRDSGPPFREDCWRVRVDLREADGSPAGSLEPHIESADPGEEAGVDERITSPPWFPSICPDAMIGLATSISRVTKSLPEFIGIDVNRRGLSSIHVSPPWAGSGEAAA
jgi:hypothetical protein